jgi:DNA anti-recombination protein RmuC
MVTAIDRLASIEKQAAGLQEDVARLDHRLDGFEKHLARIEKRLDLVESSAPGS